MNFVMKHLRRFGASHVALAYSMTTLGAGMLGSIFNFYYVKLFLNKYKISEGAFHQSQVSIIYKQTVHAMMQTKYCVCRRSVISL